MIPCLRRILSAGALALLPSMSAAGESPQMQALRQLREASREPVEVRFEDGIPASVLALVPTPATVPADPVAQALDYLGRYRDLYRLADPAGELFLRRRVAGETEHLFFGQRLGDVPVAGAEIAVHLAAGHVVGTAGAWIPDLESPPDPVLPAHEAEAAAVSHRGIAREGLRTTGAPKLVLVRPDLLAGREGEPEAPRFAWHLVLAHRPAEGAPASWSYWIDARDASVLAVRSQELFHPAEKDFSIATANGADDRDELFDEDGPTTSPPALGGDAEKAFDDLHRLYDFYFARFHRHGADSQDGQIRITVEHEAQPIPAGASAVNPAWYDACEDEIFVVENLYGTFAVMHEYAHAVIRHSVPDDGLSGPNQTGALNESYADILASFVRGVPILVRSGPTHLSQARFPRNPVCDREDPNFDDCGRVHEHAAIPSLAAKLITDGGIQAGIKVRGIGTEKAIRLFYNTVTAWLPGQADFFQARAATMNAARHLSGFTAEDRCSVRNGFAAVGLGGADQDCDGALDVDDPDDDADGVPDSQDNCPHLASPDTRDLNGDGEGDACDTDNDGDGVADGSDNCPVTHNPRPPSSSPLLPLPQPDADNDGIGDVCDDSDFDRILDPQDNCPRVPNSDQRDTDGDGQGDRCDTDDDGDGLADSEDLCPLRRRTSQFSLDSDGDRVGDECDNCPWASNRDQRNVDHDVPGDACDPDIDGDGLPNGDDNCPTIANRDQRDSDDNGIGYACDPEEKRQDDERNQWREGRARFDGRRPVRIPLGPCFLDCPPFDQGLLMEVEAVVPFTADLRIVDDRGRVVARREADGKLPLRFPVASDYRYASPGGEIFTAKEYFLEVMPLEAVEEGRYPLSLRQDLVPPE